MESDLDKKWITGSFLLGLLLTLFMPTLAPQWHLTYFAPCLMISLYQKSLAKCVLLAIVCGTIVDLLSAYSAFGLHAASYSLGLVAIYPQRRNVFADSLSTLPLMSMVFSSLSCAILALLLDVLDISNVFSWPWIATDLIFLPMADGIYSFVIYILPALVFGKQRRTGNEYFLKP